jgi:hypothetical protein
LTGADADHPPLAFTTTEKLTTYLDTGAASHWRISFVVDRPSLILAIADVHMQGASAVWLDPKVGATPGDSIRLVDLVAICERLAA